MGEELNGKVAIVTGGAGGIGRAAVERFVAEGARVVIADIDEGRGEEFASELGDAVAYQRVDVSQPDDLQAAVDLAVEQFGGLDIMFNNAGIGSKFERLIDNDLADFDTVIGIDLKGVMVGTQRAARQMAQQGGGAIVNTASVAGLVGTPGMPAYVASKHAVIGLTKTAAGEVARQGIRVNAVCPGPVDTRMIHALEAQLSPGDPAAVNQRYQASLPTGRYSTAEEIANMVLFLCSDLASNTTGGQFVVDGGRTSTGGAVTSLAGRQA
jgi:NAD(P)-dependent dehydrogenase (short-subunit alcohol dehydrogenase family)